MKFRRFTLMVCVLAIAGLIPWLMSGTTNASPTGQVASFAGGDLQALGDLGGLANVTGPYIVYSSDATSIYVVALQAGIVPDLDLLSTGQLITASPSCNPTGRPSFITLSDGYGDFLAIWTQDAKTKCYSRFRRNAGGNFSEANQGAWSADWSASDSPADLNGDGWDDLLLIRKVLLESGNSDYEYKIALGQFDGGFDFSAAPVTIVKNVWGAHFTLGDANGDGKHDLVYHSFASGGAFTTEIYMLAGNENGTFANVARRQLVVRAPTNVSSETPVLGDFNENGHADLFLPPDDDTNDMGQAYIALYNENGSSFTVNKAMDWHPDVEKPVPDQFDASAQSCDVNLDGDLDLIVRTNNIPAKTYSTSIHVGDGKGRFIEYGDVIDSGSHPGISLACSRVNTFNLSKTVSSATAQPGSIVSYEIVLTAIGDPSEMVLTDPLPDGLTYVDGSVTGGAIYDGEQIYYTGTVSSNTPLVIRYDATIDPNVALGSILNNGVLVEWEDKFTEAAATVVVPDDEVAGTLVLLYANADNDLEEHVLDLAHRAELAAGNDKVTILLLLDGPKDDDTYLYRLQKSDKCITFDVPCSDYQLLKNRWTWDENMVTVVSLSEFLIGAENAYPKTDKVVLSLIGHGWGWMPPTFEEGSDHLNLRSTAPLSASSQPSASLGGGHAAQPGGFMWDEHPNRSLSTAELGQALKRFHQATQKKIDLLYLDACSMAMTEVAYEVREYVDYLLASENTAWTSFRYKEMIEAIRPNARGSQIGEAWLAIEAGHLQDYEYPFTLSLTDLSQMQRLREAQDQLANALIDVLPDQKNKIDDAFKKSDCFDSNGDYEIVLPDDKYCDLGSFAGKIKEQFHDNPTVRQAAQNVQNRLQHAVKTEMHNNGIPWHKPDKRWKWNQPAGLSTYLPLVTDEWRRRYYNDQHLQFAQEGQWDEFLTKYWDNAEPPADPTCPSDQCGSPPSRKALASIELQVSPDVNSYVLSWTPTSSRAPRATYKLYRNENGGPFNDITTTSDTEYTDDDDDLTSTVEYCYRVEDMNNDGMMSNISCANMQNMELTNITPRYGLNNVSSAVYIYGNDFSEPLTVTLGSQILDVNFVRLDEIPQRIRAVVPEGLTPGMYDITVQTESGRASKANAYNVIEATEVDDLLSNSEWLWTDPLPMRVGFTQSSVGVLVQHLGGKETMDSVTVEFRLDGINGQLLGRSLTNLLAPDAIESTGPVTWEPQEPSQPDDDAIEYTVCAIIDPDNQVAESDETNNVICQTVDVLPPYCLPNDLECQGTEDREPPEVDSFVIADDAPSTLNTDVTLDMQATDYPNPDGSGMGTMKLLEFEYILGARRWVAVKQSNWEAYDTVQEDHPWALEDTFGMRYMQAWAADNNRNISLKPGTDVIDLLPTEQADTVGRNGVIFYRILLDQGESFSATMTPESGDPDMFVWYPDGTIDHDSDLSGIEQVGFTAPMKGTYQIEIHAPASGSASYRLAFGTTLAAQKSAPQTFDRRSQDIPEEPAVPLDEWPEYYELDLPPIVAQEPTEYTVYLPISIR